MNPLLSSSSPLLYSASPPLCSRYLPVSQLSVIHSLFLLVFKHCLSISSVFFIFHPSFVKAFFCPLPPPLGLSSLSPCSFSLSPALHPSHLITPFTSNVLMVSWGWKQSVSVCQAGSSWFIDASCSSSSSSSPLNVYTPSWIIPQDQLMGCI